MKTYLFLCFFFTYTMALCQLFLPANISKKAIEEEEIRIDLLGNGTYYVQQSGSKSAASGGVIASVPVKNKSILCISGKYNPVYQKDFILRDTAFNIRSYLPDIAKQVFGFENGSNYNIGMRYNHVKEKTSYSNSKYGIWGLIAEFNATSYKAKPDSTYWSGLDTNFTRNYTLSDGFYLFNPVIGVTREWLFSASKKKSDQNIKISVGIWLAASFIYENDAGKNVIPAFNYMILGDNALNKNFSLNQKITSFYAALFSTVFELNDFRLFINIQHNQVLFKPSELEIKGINNRPVFFNLGAGFSPSIIHFNF